MTMTAAEQIQRIRVVNRNDFTISDRFDGVPVVFEPNKPVELPPEVAEHIFRYPGDTEDTYRHMARRWGWNLPKHIAEDEHGVPLWVRQCQKIEITVSRFELRPVTDSSAPIPADDGAADVSDAPALMDQSVAPRKKTRKEISKERSARMKAMWERRRAAAGPHASPQNPPVAVDPPRGPADVGAS
jgi:hypothetical protein